MSDIHHPWSLIQSLPPLQTHDVGFSKLNKSVLFLNAAINKSDI